MFQVTESVLFRQKLYENFKDSGLLSQLKTSLRVNLLQKLQHPGKPIKTQQELLQQKKPIYLRKKFISCAIAQHLKNSNYEYSLSILLPQSGLQQNDCLGYYQLAQIINLNAKKNQQSFLQKLIQQWYRFKAQQAHQKSSQTDFDQPLSKKLQRIQKQYSPKIDYWKLIKNDNKNISQSQFEKQQKRIQNYQHQKRMLRNDLQRQIKQQMQKKYQTKYLFRIKQIQKQHQGRLNQIKIRQKQILNSLQKKKKDLQQKSKKIVDQQIKMIDKYNRRMLELELQYQRKLKQLQQKQKQYWKKQLELKAKKRQYQDSIKLIKQKVIQQSSI